MAWKTLFCGTPEFALAAAETLKKSVHYELAAILTQPDRKSGRGQKLTPSPVKLLGEKNSIPVYSPQKASSPEFLETLASENFDIAVVAAYGQILSREFLGLFPKGCYNIHGSLLPQWRGAAPIQRALMAGDSVGGVCLQKMVFKLDAGDLVGSYSMELSENLGAREYFEILAEKGAQLLADPLPSYLKGVFSATPQDSEKATYAKKILKSETLISWEKPAAFIHNLVRGLEAGPTARTTWGRKNLKVKQTRLLPPEKAEFDSSLEGAERAGVVLDVTTESVVVATGAGFLEILKLQPPGKKAMSGGDFARGYQVKKGDSFGTTI